MTKLKKVLLGHCAVDSGQLMVVDPCYLGEWKDGEAFGKDSETLDNHYSRACALTVGVGQAGGQLTVAGVAGDGVVFGSGYGDGNYPVYGFLNDEGRVLKVEVDMK